MPKRANPYRPHRQPEKSKSWWGKGNSYWCSVLAGGIGVAVCLFFFHILPLQSQLQECQQGSVQISEFSGGSLLPRERCDVLADIRFICPTLNYDWCYWKWTEIMEEFCFSKQHSADSSQQPSEAEEEACPCPKGTTKFEICHTEFWRDYNFAVPKEVFSEDTCEGKDLDLWRALMWVELCPLSFEEGSIKKTVNTWYYCKY